MLNKTTLETPTPREKIEKRPREEDSPLVTEVSAKEFKIYSKKTKTTSKVYFPPLEEIEGTIVLYGLQNLKFGSSTTDSPSYSTIKDNIATTPHTPVSFTEHR